MREKEGGRREERDIKHCLEKVFLKSKWENEYIYFSKKERKLLEFAKVDSSVR